MNSASGGWRSYYTPSAQHKDVVMKGIIQTQPSSEPQMESSPSTSVKITELIDDEIEYLMSLDEYSELLSLLFQVKLAIIYELKRIYPSQAKLLQVLKLMLDANLYW
jgi:hypothetical protein